MNGNISKKKCINCWMNELKNTFRYLGEFLHHPSTLGQEESAQQYYAELLQNLGLEVDLWYPQPQDMACNPYFLPCRVDYAGSPDVVGICKAPAGAGPCF